MLLSFHSVSLFTHLRQKAGRWSCTTRANLERDVPKSKVSQSARAPIQKLLLLKRLFVRESSRTCSFVLKSSTEGPPRESGTISPAPQSPVRRHPRSCKSTRSAARWAGHSWGYVGWAGHSRGSARACSRLPKTARQPLPCNAWGHGYRRLASAITQPPPRPQL